VTKDKALASYEEHLQAGGYAEKTVEAYLQTLGKIEWPLTLAGMEEYTNKYPPAAYSRLRAIINPFCDWVESRDNSRLDRLPKRRLPPSATPKTIRNAPSSTQVTALMLDAQKRSPELYAVLLTLARTGLRVSEVCHLNIEDYASEEKPPYITVRQGKGNKDRSVPLADAVVTAIEEQAFDSNNLTGKEPLLHNVNLNRWNPRAIQSALDRLCQGTNTPHLSPHDLRRYFATVLDRAGTRLSVVQALLGHSSVTTTMKYVRTNQEDVMNAYQKAFGGNGND